MISAFPEKPSFLPLQDHCTPTKESTRVHEHRNWASAPLLLTAALKSDLPIWF